ncbi:MAG: carboxypeptidase regulatory-like domain-containing protein [Betaproteobacteria bacterium]|jgi:hypothetical protein|nr:carboxypeptidase regulatory-like domain-containing protein [Betaproteobacteria bacterium]
MREPATHALRAALCSAVAAFALLIAAAPVRAGGGINEPHEHTEEDGPTYFGFVRDMRNTPINDAKVTLKIASGLTYVTRTDRAGLYRVRGLGKQVKPEDVQITCTKDGYQQTRVVRRPAPRGKAVKSVETECRMQRQ